VEPPELSFAGKVVTVFINTGALIFSEQPGWTLASPRLEEQLGRKFLVGETIAEHREEPYWHQGATVNIPWGSVSYYLVFESIEAYRESAARHRARAPEPAARPRPGWFGKGNRA